MNKDIIIKDIFIILFLIITLFLFYTSVSGVTESSTVSNATVAVTIGFTFSGNLSEGIQFGSVNPNTNDNNATKNYVNLSSMIGCSSSNCTGYWINMDSSNNIGSDVCIKDNANLTYGTNEIPNVGYTYDANESWFGGNMNSAAGSIAITIGYVKAGDIDIVKGENETFQFYLDIPLAQSAGTYNDTVSFKIIQTGNSCT